MLPKMHQVLLAQLVLNDRVAVCRRLPDVVRSHGDAEAIILFLSAPRLTCNSELLGLNQAMEWTVQSSRCLLLNIIADLYYSSI